MTVSTEISVDLRHAIFAIARALDYVGIDDEYHGHRVAYMAYRCAEKMGWPKQKVRKVFFTGLLHDCGVSQSTEHLRLIKQLTPQDANAHCQRGYDALMQTKVLSEYAIPVLYHHTFWQDLDKLKLSDEDKDIAAVIFLADRVDFFRARYLEGIHENLIILQEELIADNILEYRGTLFQPEMADQMVKLCMTDAFWFEMQPNNIEQIGQNLSDDDWFLKELSLSELTELALFLAKIVDAKSPFTHQHSEKVAQLAKWMADAMSLSEDTVNLIYIAGLMHDVGKLKTPDKLLHKPGKLTTDEYSHIKRHTTDTEMTLQSFFPNSAIARWASNHHERLDGTGYPHRYKADELDMPSRILAVVDVFQALTQDRPYRGRLALDEVMKLISPLVEENKLDKDVFDVLNENKETLYELSTC